MFKKINKFLEKNNTVLLASVILNAFFLVIVMFFMNVLGGTYQEHGGLSGGGGSSRSAEERAVIDVVAKSNPAVVSIVATANLPQLNQEQRRLFDFFAPYLDLDMPQDSQTRQVGGGSGFFVSPDGHIVTNRHVVDNDSLDYTVVTSGGERYDVTIVAKDPIYDVAILKIDITDAPFLTFGDSDEIVLGETVIAIGNALAEFSNSITKGVVSGLSRSVVARGRVGQTEFLENVIQTDAGINPGNSGGPLLDLDGNVIGVNVAVAAGSENIGFSLPSNLVSKIVQSVREEGRIVRPFVGVRYLVLNEQIAETEGISVTEGALVISGAFDEPAVVPNSPADKAGIREGDVIIKFNGRELNSRTSLQQVTRAAEVGESVTLTIIRDGNEERVTLILEEAPAEL